MRGQSKPATHLEVTQTEMEAQDARTAPTVTRSRRSWAVFCQVRADANHVGVNDGVNTQLLALLRDDPLVSAEALGEIVDKSTHR